MPNRQQEATTWPNDDPVQQGKYMGHQAQDYMNVAYYWVSVRRIHFISDCIAVSSENMYPRHNLKS